ncbi:50S ribosomal protein L35 [candidate division WOR-3 bacterium]|nr:50S ribosomal protein L35 [candidate division WOR-3 bacterium]
MPKVKTHSAAKKRFKVLPHGGIKRKKGFHAHLLTGKTRKRKRHLRSPGIVDKSDEKRVKRLLPYK